jgi:hypothetical protein
MGNNPDPQTDSYSVTGLGHCTKTVFEGRVFTTRQLLVLDSADEDLKTNALLRRVGRQGCRHLLPIYKLAQRRQEKVCGEDRWLTVHSCFIRESLEDKLQALDQRGEKMTVEDCWSLL